MVMFVERVMRMRSSVPLQHLTFVRLQDKKLMCRSSHVDGSASIRFSAHRTGILPNLSSMRLECRKKPVPPAAMFKLIRRFLFGSSPFFLLLSAAPFLFFFGTPPPRMASWVVAVSAHRYRANEIPIVEHCGIKSLRAAGDVPGHLNQVIRNRTVYPFHVIDLDKGGVVKTAWNFPTKNRQRVRIVIKFILVFQSTRPTNRSDFSRAGCHWEIGRIGNLLIGLYFIFDRSARTNLQAVSHRSRISPYCIHDRFSG